MQVMLNFGQSGFFLRQINFWQVVWKWMQNSCSGQHIHFIPCDYAWMVYAGTIHSFFSCCGVYVCVLPSWLFPPAFSDFQHHAVMEIHGTDLTFFVK